MWRKIEIPVMHDERGKLSVLESGDHLLSFEIKRLYYLHDLQTLSERGGHAHIELHQIIIAMNGSFNLELTSRSGREIFHLNNASTGIYVGPGVWRRLFDFSTGCVVVVLASEVFNEQDYIRDYEQFRRLYCND